MVQQAVRPDRAPAMEPERVTMTLGQYRDWQTEERNRGEWVDGEVIVFVAPKTVHKRLSRFLTALIDGYASDHDLGEVLQTPEMRLRDGGSYREPDIAFIATAHAGRITADGIDGPADLVIEIISEDSVRRDRKHKYDEYEATGVREYWVIDPRPLLQTVYAYVLGDEGIFNPIGTNESSEIASVVLPGFWIDPAWLWRNPTPNVAETLRTIEAGR